MSSPILLCTLHYFLHRSVPSLEEKWTVKGHCALEMDNNSRGTIDLYQDLAPVDPLTCAGLQHP